MSWVEQYGKNGVWVLYDYDTSAYAISIHVESVKAIKAMTAKPSSHIAFWPFDTELPDAIEWWTRVNRPGG